MGPLCEICNTSYWPSAKYFDETEARCLDCPDAAGRVGGLLGALLAALALVGLVGWILVRRPKRLRRCSSLALRLLRRLHLKVNKFALTPKAKLLIAFYQSVQVLPTVYSVELPEEYYEWMSAVSFLELDWSGLVVPGACLDGGYLSRLLLRGLMPLGLMLLLLLLGWLVDVARHVTAVANSRGVIAGYAVISCAMTPLTWGHAIDVPERTLVAVGELVSAALMLTPGAMMSVHEP